MTNHTEENLRKHSQQMCCGCEQAADVSPDMFTHQGLMVSNASSKLRYISQKLGTLENAIKTKICNLPIHLNIFVRDYF